MNIWEDDPVPLIPCPFCGNEDCGGYPCPGFSTSKKLKLLIPKWKIQQRVCELGQKITTDFEGKEVLLIGVLKGSFMFLADLVRNINLPTTFDFIGVSSYGYLTESSKQFKITKELEHSVVDKQVLLIEDIVDTGWTLTYLRKMLKLYQPKSLLVVTLLDKPSRRETVAIINYTGFTIENHFVVGYGMDYDEQYRNLPDIYTIKEKE